MFLKMLVQTLNDIRVLLADVYSREYMLESLRHFEPKELIKDKLINNAENGAPQKKQLLTFDTVREFLDSVIELMLQFNSGSS